MVPVVPVVTVPQGTGRSGRSGGSGGAGATGMVGGRGNCCLVAGGAMGRGVAGLKPRKYDCSFRCRWDQWRRWLLMQWRMVGRKGCCYLVTSAVGLKYVF